MYRISEKNTVDAGQTYWAQENVSHIITDVLYPAIAGKLLDGSTSHSGAYGTAQADGRKYYRTDIGGSKPIKDPRIGAHFGSQRYRISSAQILEQETGMHGENVYSIDGREWMRVAETGNPTGEAWMHNNDSNGQRFQLGNGSARQCFIEITGYFSDANIVGATISSSQPITIQIDGASTVAKDPFSSSTNDPKIGRYVNPNTLANLALGATLGIHTLRINSNGKENTVSGIELIAQDTTSTATKSQIQIPSQNVVSYGKKFTVAGTPHYNPFAFKTDGSTAWTSGNHNGTAWPIGTGSSTKIHTATSLGLAAWISTNYYYPYNGGRVVKWIDTDGVIQTSVNMMPPNAQNLEASSITAKANASVANDTYLPTFSGAIDHSQAEVAKTFHWREFGNGAANQGTDGSKADASMLVSNDDIGYVMDDGLTSLGGDDMYNHSTYGFIRYDLGDGFNLTFIGTGLTTETYLGTRTWAQNMPYGTHIFSMKSVGSNGDEGYAKMDGASIKSNFAQVTGIEIYKWMLNNGDISIHQPKMPPIPEDAVILADYMLMADFVSIPDNTAGNKEFLSKGVRRISSSRDVHMDSGATITFDGPSPGSAELDADAFRVYNNNTNTVYKLPYFGTSVSFRSGVASDRQQDSQFKINGTLVTTSSSGTNHSGTQVLKSWTSGSHGFSSDNNGTFTMIGSSAQGWVSASGFIPGQNTVAVHSVGTQYITFNGYDVASPIHTSSHYQTFETPFLHELVGGDRNMEQNNLVVTADGKTWDEVTRDTSYMGNVVLSGKGIITLNAETVVFFEYWRGKDSSRTFDHYGNKDFAIARERYICLRAGTYSIHVCSISAAVNVPNNHAMIWVNGVNVASASTGSNGWQQSYSNIPLYLDRGDYVEIRGRWYGGSGNYNQFRIHRMPELKKKYDKSSAMNQQQIQKLNY